MTATKLYELTKPIFDKHPSAKPEWLQWRSIAERWVTVYQDAENVRASNGLTDEAAALIVQGHLVEWLCSRHATDFFLTSWGWQCTIDRPNRTFERETLLEALIAACMEVECSR
jgi:hypothetical protein